jgi:hypothetical protein
LNTNKSFLLLSSLEDRVLETSQLQMCVFITAVPHGRKACGREARRAVEQTCFEEDKTRLVAAVLFNTKQK